MIYEMLFAAVLVVHDVSAAADVYPSDLPIHQFSLLNREVYVHSDESGRPLVVCNGTSSTAVQSQFLGGDAVGTVSSDDSGADHVLANLTCGYPGNADAIRGALVPSDAAVTTTAALLNQLSPIRIQLPASAELAPP